MGRPAKNLKKITEKVVKILNGIRLSYLLTGGIASVLYGSQRDTFDLDFVIKREKEKIELLIKKLTSAGFIVDEEEIQFLSKLANRFFIEYPAKPLPVRVDFWISKTVFDRHLFERQKKLVIGKQRVRTISPEDLLLDKIHTGRSKDLKDTLGIIAKLGKKLDYKYLHFWAKILNIHDELKKVLKQAKEEIGRY